MQEDREHTLADTNSERLVITVSANLMCRGSADTDY